MTEKKKTKKELNPLERLLLLSILPARNQDIVTLKMSKELGNRFGLSAEEIDKYEIETIDEGRNIKYNQEKIKETKEFEFTNSEMKFISKIFKEKDKNKELTASHIELYDFFVGDEDED